MALRLGRRNRSSSGVVDGTERVRSRGLWGKLAILVLVLLVATPVGGYAYDKSSTAHFYPGTKIGGVLIGSRSADEAESLLHERFVVPLRRELTITAPEFVARTSPWAMGMRIDVNDAVRDALVRQQAEGAPLRMLHRVFGASKEFRLRPKVHDAVFDKFLGATFEEVNQDPQDARLEVSGDILNVIPHRVGRQVDDETAELRIFNALRAGESRIDLPVKVQEPTLRTQDFNTVILVSTSANTLKLYKGDDLMRKYRVATGTGGYPTPRGQFSITAKRFRPTWYNPNSDWSQGMPAFIPPGPNNPLGTRALNLSASGIRIHGTPNDASIGTNASHGCIRMHMPDAEDLYERVEVNTPVLIV